MYKLTISSYSFNCFQASLCRGILIIVIVSSFALGLQSCEDITRCSECLFDASYGLLPFPLHCVWCESSQKCLSIPINVTNTNSNVNTAGNDKIYTEEYISSIASAKANLSNQSSFIDFNEFVDSVNFFHNSNDFVCSDLRDEVYNPTCPDMHCSLSHKTNNIYICRWQTILALTATLFLLLVCNGFVWMWLRIIEQLPWQYEPILSALLENKDINNFISLRSNDKNQNEGYKTNNRKRTDSVVILEADVNDDINENRNYKTNTFDETMNKVNTSAHVDIYDTEENDVISNTYGDCINKDHSLENKSQIQKNNIVAVNERDAQYTNWEWKQTCLINKCEYSFVQYYCPICKQEQFIELCPGDVCPWCHIARWGFVPLTISSCVSVIMLLSMLCVSLKPFFSDVYYAIMLTVGYGGYVFGCLYVYYWIHHKAANQVELYEIDSVTNNNNKSNKELIKEEMKTSLEHANCWMLANQHNALLLHSEWPKHTKEEIELLMSAHRAMSETYYVKLAIRLRGRRLHSVFPLLESELERIRKEYLSNSININRKKDNIITSAKIDKTNLVMDNSRIKSENNKNLIKLLIQSPSSLSLQRTCDIAIKSHPVKIDNSSNLVVVSTNTSTGEQMDNVNVCYNKGNNDNNITAQIILRETSSSTNNSNSNNISTSMKSINGVNEKKCETDKKIDIINSSMYNKNECDDGSNKNVEENNSSVEINTQNITNTCHESTKLYHALSANSINNMIHTNSSSSSSSMTDSFETSSSTSSISSQEIANGKESKQCKSLSTNASQESELTETKKEHEYLHEYEEEEELNIEESYCNNEQQTEFDSNIHIEPATCPLSKEIELNNNNKPEMIIMHTSNDKHGKSNIQIKLSNEMESVENAQNTFVNRKIRETISLLQIGMITQVESKIDEHDRENNLPHSFRVALKSILPIHKYHEYISATDNYYQYNSELEDKNNHNKEKNFRNAYENMNNKNHYEDNSDIEYMLWYYHPSCLTLLYEMSWLFILLVLGIAFGIWLYAISFVHEDRDVEFALIRLSGSLELRLTGSGCILLFVGLLVLAERGLHRCYVCTNQRLMTLVYSGAASLLPTRIAYKLHVEQVIALSLWKCELSAICVSGYTRHGLYNMYVKPFIKTLQKLSMYKYFKKYIKRRGRDVVIDAKNHIEIPSRSFCANNTFRTNKKNSNWKNGKENESVFAISWQTAIPQQKLPHIHYNSFIGLDDVHDLLSCVDHLVKPNNLFRSTTYKNITKDVNNTSETKPEVIVDFARLKKSNRKAWKLYMTLSIIALLLLPVVTIYPHALPLPFAWTLHAMLFVILGVVVERGIFAQIETHSFYAV